MEEYGLRATRKLFFFFPKSMEELLITLTSLSISWFDDFYINKFNEISYTF